MKKPNPEDIELAKLLIITVLVITSVILIMIKLA